MAIHPIFEPIIELARGQANAWAQDARLKRLLEKVAKYEAALLECLEYFEANADVVDGSDGHPAPDKCMRLQQMIQETLGKGGY